MTLFDGLAPAADETPMMRQYHEWKRRYPDYLLLFRLGDFYEAFHEYAAIAARALDIALTSRQKGDGAIPMAGVGDTLELAIPATMAYGTEGRGPIPGGSTLLFTIELLGIEGR